MNIPKLACLILAAALYITTSTYGSIIEVFNFNSPISDGNPLTGTYLSVHSYGVYGFGSEFYGSIVDGSGSLDPNTNDNSAFGAIGFDIHPDGPNRTEGIGFTVNFYNFRDIHLTADAKFSQNSADRLLVQYVGSDNAWHDFSVISSQSPGWVNSNQFDFSGISYANDFPGFKVRLVTLYASPLGFQSPGGGAYSGGSIAFDNVVWSGTPISGTPEPGTVGLLMVAGLRFTFLRWRIRKSTS